MRTTRSSRPVACASVRRRAAGAAFLLILALVAALPATAQKKQKAALPPFNPVIQTKYTADPAPVVIRDTVFLYTSHDESDATGFLMKNWMLYTTTDMVNYTDHGIVASLEDFAWARHDNGAWAPQVIERDGKYFMYCPVHGHGIGVLVADSPYGPFHDPLGQPLVWQKEHWEDIDPTVWIDDDGQAYMYWGNPNLYCVRLNRDMISYDGPITKCAAKPKDYQEGPWFYKRGSHYYLAYASTCCPEGIGYSMADSPTGPWDNAHTLVDHNRISDGNHPGIITYRGHDYVYSFTYNLHFAVSDTKCERRSVSLAELHYNADGTLPEMAFWNDQVVQPLETLNPYRRVEAETIAWADGVTTARAQETGMYVTDIHNTDYILVRNVDFGPRGATRFEASVASLYKDGSIEIRLDAPDGRLAGTCEVGSTRGDLKWQMRSCDIKGAKGVHDLYLVFTAPAKHRLFNFDWWRFSE